MSYQAEALERTKLKFLGVYLQCGGSPGQYLLEHDETEEELTSRTRGELETLLQDMARSEDILEAAESYSEACQRVGFYSGIKIGARLMLSLTDVSDIVF